MVCITERTEQLIQINETDSDDWVASGMVRCSMFTIPYDTLRVTLEMICTANHLTDAQKTGLLQPITWLVLAKQI